MADAWDPTPAEKVYTWTLIVMCLSLMLFLLVKLGHGFRNKSKKLSWATCFDCICLLWTIVRVSFWMSLELRDHMTYLELYLLYWFPTPIQFANFALLVLFYIQVITGSAWHSTWRNVCVPLYLFMTLCMAAFTAIWAFTSNSSLEDAFKYGDQYDQEMYKISAVKTQLEYSSISFFLLSFLFAFFGWKLAHVRDSTRHRLLISKPRSVAIFNSLLFVIFFTRSMRDLATSQNWLRFSVLNPVDQFGQITSFSYFILFVVWDFLPTVLLLLLVSTEAGGVGPPRHNKAHDRQLPDFGIFQVIKTGHVAERVTSETSHLAASPKREYGARTTPINVADQQKSRWTRGGDLFQDPLRYDSDDGNGATPTYVNSLNSESSLSATSSYDRASSYTPL
ncbi:hypothetical protein SPRG_07761 [Saprolegnia parasitica CBS 223.65]|uniref:THH1/TOM1/TOM3 domain-containing protein n=1 Tax=Saprolegnia parasitica (strain CBS 223.65) TaxID=695850 RepID=A0A067CCZ2_SAPPC|nr:hypothetical protein SPRG_07761 [Saprolegnia parasitica CBS 223.65]KDO27050.1 hypothetical protein SPRG_07761 [Saprolegnia parasitica CBS 223.65]|eukprot:XP_012202145.1 hypothetical protein SPRG_07761 [Saprolegnia parasitica CBS 223.65]